jgi:hypothetical protein
VNRSIFRDNHFNDDCLPVRPEIKGRKIGGKLLGQHWKYLRRGVHRSGVMPGVIVKRRLPLYKAIDIGNGNKDLCGALRHCLGNRKLVQVAGVVVVNGTPQKISEVAGLPAGARCRLSDSIKLGKGLRRKIGNKSPVNHRLAGNVLQDGAVLNVVGICHAVIKFTSVFYDIEELIKIQKGSIRSNISFGRSDRPIIVILVGKREAAPPPEHFTILIKCSPA